MHHNSIISIILYKSSKALVIIPKSSTYANTESQNN